MILFALACIPEPPPVEAATPSLEWRPPDERGAAAVGVRTDTIPDPRGGALTVDTWYPAEADGPPARYEIPYQVHTVGLREATPLEGPFPLVLFSHGHGGSRHQSLFLMEQLASHGFVVIAVDHPNDTFNDLDLDLTARVASRRPDDVRMVLDWALSSTDDPSHWLGSVVREDRVAVMGHSFGAWTSLVLAGGVLDLEAGLHYCNTVGSAGCNIVGGIEDMDHPPQPDPRISMAVVMAPGGWYSFSDLTPVSPVLVLSGDKDLDLPFEQEQRPTFEALGDNKKLLILHGAGHFGFTDACALLPIADCEGVAAGFMDPLRIQALSSTAVTAFFGAELRQDERYQPWIGQDLWTEEVSWD